MTERRHAVKTRGMRRVPFFLLGALSLAACGGGDETKPKPETEPEPEVECVTNADCSDTPDTPFCSEVCSPMPQGWQIGVGDGTASSVSLTVVHQPDKGRRSTDLAFNPSVPDQLWVINYQDDSTVIVDKVGQADSSWQRLRDPAASHFMEKPPALAFGVVVEQYGQTFGVCGDGDNGGNKFMGPALFSADLSIYAVETPGGLGSHLDMLHSTSFCRGIAHIEGNVYFAFNSDKQSLDKYDFVIDHGPGNDDHSDGQIWRYVEDQVAGVDGVPSHLFYVPETKLLYVADTGNQRVAVLDTASGTMGASFGGDEPADRTRVEGATLTELVPAGTMQAPSGIEVHGDVLFVGDNATSTLYAFDLEGNLLRSLETGLAPGALVGLAVGPADDKLYLVDKDSSIVYRIDPIL